MFFPDAVKMLKENPDGLTWRFKKIAAAVSLPTDSDPDSPQACNPCRCIAGSLKGRSGDAGGQAARRVMDCLKRLCSGEKHTILRRKLGDRSQVSSDLHHAEEISGFLFMPLPAGKGKQGTNKPRNTGKQKRKGAEVFNG